MINDLTFRMPQHASSEVTVNFCIRKTKRRLHDRKTEHFKALAKNCRTSAITDHITSTGRMLSGIILKF